jgi:uncharacterized membrane protein
MLARVRSPPSADDKPGHGAFLLRRFAWALLGACVIKWLFGDTLYWSVIGDPDAARALAQVVNVQMIVALLLAASAMALWVMGRRGPEDDSVTPVAWFAPVAAAVVVLWAGTFEIDRAIAQLSVEQTAALAFDPWHLRLLWWTGLWAVGGFVMTWLGNRRALVLMAPSGWGILVVAAIAWLTADTLVWRVTDGRVPTTPFLNVQFGIGALLIALLALTMRVRMAAPAESRAFPPFPKSLRTVGFALIALIGLWLGSFEIDRLPNAEPMARQAGLSVYWALYGVALVIIGFARHAAAARYAGLALLAITMLKVVFVDLATIDFMWRVASFLVSGLLLIGTSMLYQRLSPQLLGRERDGDDVEAGETAEAGRVP